MRKIFAGLVFVLLDFHIGIGRVRIGLLPAFVGYILVYRGLKELCFESDFFRKPLPFAAGMGVYTGILYVCDLSGTAGPGQLLLGIAALLIQFYIEYRVLQGILVLEQKYCGDLSGSPLKIMLLIRFIGNAAILYCSIRGIAILPLTIISICVHIAYLVVFGRMSKRYGEIRMKFAESQKEPSV